MLNSDGVSIGTRARVRGHILAALFAAALAGCGGGGGGGADVGSSATPTPPPPPPPPAGLQAAVVKSHSIAIDVPIVAGAADPFGGNVSGTAVLDFDGDGLKDLLITPSYLSAQPELSVILLRQTSTGFVDGRAAFGGTVPTTGVARTPEVADFNLDGKDDYFSADTGLEVTVNGQFIDSQNRLFLSGSAPQLAAHLLPTLAFNHGSCMGDIDGDGRVDLAVAPLSPPKTYLLLNTTAGWQMDQTRLPVELSKFSPSNDFNPSSCALADIDGDGKLDLIVSGYGDGIAAGSPNAPYATGTRIFLNDGTGHFRASAMTLPRPTGEDWGSTSIRVADFDGDGRPDLLVAYELPNRRQALQLWLQKAPGEFTDATIAWLGSYEPSVGFWRETDVADFNGDSKPDIYLKSADFSSAGTAEVLQRCILLNTGSGFTSPGTIHLSEQAAPVFMVPLKIVGKTFTLVGYEVSGSPSAYTSLTPVTVSIAF